MMYSKKAMLCCLALVCLLGGVVAAIEFRPVKDSGPDLQDMLGVPKTAMRVHLYGANRDPKTGESASGIVSGYDINSADGKTKVVSHNEFVNGGAEEVHYRGDESKEWSRDYFPKSSAEEQAVQRSVAWFAADGKTYAGHEVRRPDGSWERHGELLADGNYRQTYYCKDGRTAQKIQLFDKAKKFVSEQAIFCETGKSVRATATGEYGKKILTLFNVDGKPTVQISQQDNYESVDYSGDIFADSGEVIAHYTEDYGMYGSYSKYETLKNGRVEMEWSATMGMSSNTSVTAYDTSNAEKHKRFEQSWAMNVAYTPAKGQHLLKVIEYAADGKTTLREIEFNADGVPTHISMPTNDSAKTLVYTLDAQGSKVVKAALHVVGQKDEIEQPLPADTNVRIAAEETKEYKHADEPKWDDGNTDVGNKLYDFP